ncbi:MAG: DoxX family protein [Ignavibacteriae bacterium]|nr:DoxX family protein [Ignavibacteriota bacterium]
MKAIFSTMRYNSSVDLIIFVARIWIGCFMLTHGTPKLMQFFSNEPLHFADPLGIGITASLSLAVFAEFFCACFLILGLASRAFLIPLIINMSVAGFIFHVNDPFGKKEMAFLFLLVYLILFVLGSGKYSIDRMIERKLNQ